MIKPLLALLALLLVTLVTQVGGGGVGSGWLARVFVCAPVAHTMRQMRSRFRAWAGPACYSGHCRKDFVSAPGPVGAMSDPQPRRARVVIGSWLRSKADR